MKRTRMALFLICISCFFVTPVHARTEASDIVFYKNKDWRTSYRGPLTYPLEDYFEKQGKKPPFKGQLDCVRGYIATWEILEGVLYLKKVQDPGSNVEFSLKNLFPDFTGKAVKASWFSGAITIESGESDLVLLEIEKGVIRSEAVTTKDEAWAAMGDCSSKDPVFQSILNKYSKLASCREKQPKTGN